MLAQGLWPLYPGGSLPTIPTQQPVAEPTPQGAGEHILPPCPALTPSPCPGGSVSDGGAPLPSQPSPAAPPALECGKRGTSYQPSRRKRINKHGMEKRLSTPSGRETLLRRLNKGRWRITVDSFR